MRTTLDHIVVSASDLAAGVAYVETALEVPVGPGGAHAVMGTHNRLLSLGRADYLEVIAVDTQASPPNCARWYGLDAFQGAPKLTNWALRVDDLDAALARAPDGIGAPLEVTRGENRWRISLPEGGAQLFDGLFPALIEWETPPPAPLMADHGARLISLTLSHPKAGALGWALAPFLEDDRVLVTKGAVGMQAQIHTRSGVKSLS